MWEGNAATGRVLVQATAVILKKHKTWQFQNEVISTSPITVIAFNFHDLSLKRPHPWSIQKGSWVRKLEET